MKNKTYLYRGSLADARQFDQVSLWRASHQANIACKAAIEASIRKGFDGMYLKESCVQDVLEEYGFKRVVWVLANTVREKLWDGRFSQTNKEWARCQMIPPDPEHNCDFIVGSHPAVLDGFLNEVRAEYQKLNLFGPEHCHPDSYAELDYTGKVLVLSADTLKEAYWSQENQLWYAHDGFGCQPHAIGRSIRCTCLGDGEDTRWNRTDFTGVLKDELLPDWASEKMKELIGQKNPDLQKTIEITEREQGHFKGPTLPDHRTMK